MPARRPEERVIGLVASQFPRPVDAYFLREISELARRGLRFRIFSLQAAGGAVLHETARPFVPVTEYIPFLLSRRLLTANLRALLRAPGRYLGALGSVIAGCAGKPRALLKSLAVFPKSVYFAEVARAEGVAHIHANWASYPATSALVMARLTGLPWSFGAHASDLYLDGSMLRRKIEEARFVVTCTRHNGAYLERVAGPEAAHKVAVSYHGVDLDRFSPASERAGGPFSILTVGTIRDCKGLPDLVEAVRDVVARGLDVRCTIVGDGEERPALERLIRRLGVEPWVRITGYLSQEALIPLYQQADVLVLPARPESHFGIPNILLEALAVATPVVCTRLPSLAEVMEDGEHGLFVPDRDVRALAAALQALAGDPERRRAMGEAGRRKMEALFDARKNANGLERLFRPAPAAHPEPAVAPGIVPPGLPAATGGARRP